MLTDKQCIEIAEKVWGMEFTFNEYDPTAPSLVHRYSFKKDGLTLSWHKNDLKREVLSWSGFGRTVEAMDTKGKYFKLDFRLVDSAKDIIEKAHLHALEALK